ncbi:MAG: penicillin-binding protein 1C [Sphingobium sp.]|jgi:penicillin-binding protein 1C|nr:penicillin-binding protein 1C [Sphingobium sp.]MCI1271600.1 penicillin-binding protein 1C [Sphingobium sp.]MCI1754839.1 penicillin-binding protein 1C [Sphingobium sp.]MCI2053660.1 penicillin-binding protein 1C [Sphingobium sp.]
MGALTRLPGEWRRWGPPALLIAMILVYAALNVLTAPPSLPDYAQVRRDWRPSEAWLYDREGKLLDRIRVDYQARRLGWTPLDAINPAMRDAVIRGEDRRFATHEGVDWLALGNAALARLRGDPARGASTISMQLAAYLSPQMAAPGARGWRDKLRQMRAAWALEEDWSKAEILEAYLNLAPYRGEAQGVAAASMTLFGKSPSVLDRREAALLAALLPDPAAPPARVATRACRLVEAADCTALPALASRMLSPGRLRALDPGLAPHLANHLLRTPGARVATTLDAAVQRVASQALRHQLQGLGPTRARDGAVIVLDNATGDVLAYVGGVGLGSTAEAVNGAEALRQAGSTLKPFLYAQLIERKWLTAASILEDSPVQLDTASGLYVPRNYDNAFLGPVSVRRALANSLNVPAVRALVLDGVQDFRDRLWDLGYADLNPDGGYYGFSLALGSAEVTLLQQANAYRTLANLGRWSPVRLRKADPAGEVRTLIDPGAAWITADMLADAGARSGTFGVDSALRLPFWAAAKTGTSKAMRDNWCIGFSDRFTVAVWVGNLEGDPMRAVSGTSGAAPVWRDVMLALHQGRPGSAPPRPASVTGARIAFTRSGEAARTEWFLTGTAQATLAEAPAFARRPRIVNPVSGSVYAADPDIPANRQGLGIAVSGAAEGYRLTLDGRGIGGVSAAPQLPLLPGSHLLALLDESGRKVDQVRFTVR